MGWNHRILAHDDGDGQFYFQMHEVYYDENGKPDSYTKNAVTIAGENLKAITWSLNKMKEARKKPVLLAGDKFPEEYKGDSIVLVGNMKATSK